MAQGQEAEERHTQELREKSYKSTPLPKKMPARAGKGHCGHKRDKPPVVNVTREEPADC